MKNPSIPPRHGLRRLLYVYSWRMRYWWLDTRAGDLTRRGSCLVAALVAFVLVVDHLRAPPPPAGSPQQAFVWWVQLIIMVVALLVSSMLSKTDQTKPEVQKADIPTTEEGTSFRRIYGTRRVTDPVVLAWQSNGTRPIKAKGGKK
ncbi:hypothetical protein [Xanthomonas sacchari]|uniref:hypothetical protein n=1 Tax=Xanthomonas sacchari TaxID=56458 RepID=UPI0022563020|nr:hypothetical protein [Xanthomonas sacchari]UYK72512.1 hypothetical protein NG828_20385 [Xanthomonas sacchari]